MIIGLLIGTKINGDQQPIDYPKVESPGIVFLEIKTVA